MAGTNQPAKTAEAKDQDNRERIRYVEVSSPSGWQTMTKTVREVDEDKIGDCKDDIDTLLVFAGLYSAVLSAFVLETYSSLQLDPETQMVFLLQQIAVQTQSYTVTSSFMNSTAQPSIPPPFSAPEWAVRVNGLWFASLVVSLATASLSMLVKQWLREYLAVERTAPQERLRARQYRRPALDKWRVFEIAAILPILLQVSLGLFFVGLCFFTASVDERMGRATVPLVSGWAFFILATTACPLFSPRCPYKTPLLKSIFRTARIQVTMKLRRSCEAVLERAIGRLGAKLNIMQDEEEEKVIAGSKDDAEILILTDSIMSDDNLLSTTWDAFNQHSQKPAQAISFILRLIANRLGSQGERLPLERLRCIPDLSALSRRAWDTFMEALAEVANRHQGPLQVSDVDSSPDWLFDLTLIFLSNSPHSLPDTAVSSLRALLAAQWKREAYTAIAKWVAPRPGDSEFVFRPISQSLLPVFDVSTSPNLPSLTAIYLLYREFLLPYCTGSTVPPSLYQTLYQERGLFRNRHARPILEDMWTLTCSSLAAELKDRRDYRPGSAEGFTLMLELGELMDRRADVLRIFTSYWVSSQGRYLAMLRSFASIQPCVRASGEHILGIVLDAFMQSDAQVDLVNSSTSMARLSASGGYQDVQKYTPLDMVRFCFMHLKLYAKYIDPAVTPAGSEDNHKGNQTTGSNSINWTTLWKETSSALRKYFEEKKWDAKHNPQYWYLTTVPVLAPNDLLAKDRELARECLELIESTVHNRSLNGGDPHSRDRAISEELVSALGLFIQDPPVEHLNGSRRTDGQGEITDTK